VENPKKVLIFSVTYYPRLVGGDVVAIKEITDRLDQNEFEFHLVTLRFDKKLPKEEKVGNVFVHRLGFVGEMKETADSLSFPLHYNKYIYTLTGAWKGLQLHKKYHFSLVWGITANYAGFAALFFKLFKPKIPYLLTLQEGDPLDHYKKRVGVLYGLHQMIFKKADQVQAISAYLAAWGKKMGFSGWPVVVPNGVDTKLFTKEISEEDRKNLRESLGLKNGDVALITTSRLVIKNGVGDVIQALAKLGENIKFVICGEGYLKDELVKMVDELNVSNRVIWKGYVPHSEMPKYLKACDIFTRPSLSEGFGNSFIEAMAARIPVIATTVGGIADFLFPGKTGYACEPEDPESIVRAVNDVLNNSEKKHAIIEEAYQLATQKYDWNLVAGDMKKVFDNTINIK